MRVETEEGSTSCHDFGYDTTNSTTAKLRNTQESRSNMSYEQRNGIDLTNSRNIVQCNKSIYRKSVDKQVRSDPSSSSKALSPLVGGELRRHRDSSGQGNSQISSKYNTSELEHRNTLNYNSQSCANETTCNISMPCNSSLHVEISSSRRSSKPKLSRSFKQFRRNSIGSTNNCNVSISACMRYDSSDNEIALAQTYADDGLIRDSRRSRRHSLDSMKKNNAQTCDSTQRRALDYGAATTLKSYAERVIPPPQSSLPKDRVRSFKRGRRNSVNSMNNCNITINNFVQYDSSDGGIATGQTTTQKLAFRSFRQSRRHSLDSMKNHSDSIKNHSAISNSSALYDSTEYGITTRQSSPKSSFECETASTRPEDQTRSFKLVRTNSVDSINNYNVTVNNFMQPNGGKVTTKSRPKEGGIRSFRQTRRHSVDSTWNRNVIGDCSMQHDSLQRERGATTTQSGPKQGVLRKFRHTRRHSFDSGNCHSAETDDSSESNESLDFKIAPTSSDLKDNQIRNFRLTKRDSMYSTNLGSVGNDNSMQHENFSDHITTPTKYSPKHDVSRLKEIKTNSDHLINNCNVTINNYMQYDSSDGEIATIQNHSQHGRIRSSRHSRRHSLNSVGTDNVKRDDFIQNDSLEYGIAAEQSSAKKGLLRRFRHTRRHSVDAINSYNVASDEYVQTNESLGYKITPPQPGTTACGSRSFRPKRRNSMDSINSYKPRSDDSKQHKSSPQCGIASTHSSLENGIRSSAHTRKNSDDLIEHHLIGRNYSMQFSDSPDGEIAKGQSSSRKGGIRSFRQMRRTASMSNIFNYSSDNGMASTQSSVSSKIQDEGMEAGRSDRKMGIKSKSRLQSWKPRQKLERTVICESFAVHRETTRSISSLSSTDLKRSLYFGKSRKRNLNQRSALLKDVSNRELKQTFSWKSYCHMLFSKMACVVYINLLLAANHGSLWLLFVFPSLFLVKLAEVINKWFEYHRNTKGVSDRPKKTFLFRLNHFFKPWQDFCDSKKVNKAKYFRVAATAYGCEAMLEAFSRESMRKRVCEANQLFIKEIDEKIKEYDPN